ncbi:MAG TPA: hypothetical protein VMA09_19220 [Candidatus Binataceae bacterium]|nr:hypothetical protein [Candidatus Binataceae bacterium]
MRIDELERHLGTAEGLAHVEQEVQEICEELSIRPPSHEELIELAASLAMLSGRIYEHDRLIRDRIRTLGGETSNVG